MLSYRENLIIMKGNFSIINYHAHEFSHVKISSFEWKNVVIVAVVWNVHENMRIFELTFNFLNMAKKFSYFSKRFFFLSAFVVLRIRKVITLQMMMMRWCISHGSLQLSKVDVRDIKFGKLFSVNTMLWVESVSWREKDFPPCARSCQEW